MLEYLVSIIRWLICKLIFKNHKYKLICSEWGYKTYRCIVCGKTYDEETPEGATIWKQYN